MSKHRVKMVCSHCGGEDVFADAYAEWDVEAQAWEVTQTFERAGTATSAMAKPELRSNRSHASPRPVWGRFAPRAYPPLTRKLALMAQPAK